MQRDTTLLDLARSSARGLLRRRHTYRLRTDWRALSVGLLMGLCLFTVGTKAKSTPAPPDEVSKAAHAILTYFCQAWKSTDYDAMYGALSEQCQSAISRETWNERLKEERATRGGVDHFKLDGPTEDLGSKSLWSISITYENSRAGTLRKQSWVVQDEDGWRIGEGGLLPRNGEETRLVSPSSNGSNLKLSCIASEQTLNSLNSKSAKK